MTLAFSGPQARAAEIALAAFGLAFALAVAYMSADLAAGGRLTAWLAGAAAGPRLAAVDVPGAGDEPRAG